MRSLSFIVPFFVHVVACAQSAVDSVSVVPFSVVKISPFHLLNFYPTAELAYEQRVFKRVTVQAEGGYVLDYGSNSDIKFQNKRGVKLKFEGRYYFGSTTGRETVFYSALEPYMNIIDFDRYGVEQECFDAECYHPYNREFIMVVRYRERGTSVKGGMLWYSDPPFLIDVNIGFTLRDIHYYEPALPPGAQINDEPGFLRMRPSEEDRRDVSPVLGMRLGYRLK